MPSFAAPSDILFKSSLRPPASHHPPARPSSPGSKGAWPSTTLTAEQLYHTHWNYLAEGGKNLLLRFDADRVHEAKGDWVNGNASRALALRLVKRERTSGCDSDKSNDPPVSQHIPSAGSYVASSSSLASRPDFEASVIAPLLQDPSLLPVTFRLPMPRDAGGSDAHVGAHSLFLEKVAARIELARPAERCKTSGVDLSAAFLDVVEDLTWAAPGDEVLAVEIKPKWLFPVGQHSRYKQHRVLKSKGKLTLEEYNALYDPLDLVSGDQGRIAKATQALVGDWENGGNNLRVFINGKAVTNTKSEQLQRLLSQLTSSSPTSSTSSFNSTTSLSSIIEQILSAHDAQCVLRRIAHLQSSLAPVDIRSLAAWWSAQTGGQALGQEKDLSSLSAPPTLDEYRSFVEDWKEMVKTNSNDSARGADHKDDGEGEKTKSSSLALTLRQAVLGTLLSATFKDCSIFLRLGPQRRAGSTGGHTSSDDSTSQTRRAHAPKDEPDLQTQTLTSINQERSIPSTHTTSSPSPSSYVDPDLLGLRTGGPQQSSNDTFYQLSSSSDGADVGHTLRLVDVDAKPLSKLRYWLELEEDLEKAFETWKSRVGLE